MKPTAFRAFIALTLLSACGGSAPATNAPSTEVTPATEVTAAPAIEERELSEESALTIGSANLHAPTGWHTRSSEGWREFSTPDREIRIRLEEHVSLAEPDREQAIAQAWQAFGAPAGLTQASRVDQGGNDLWEERLVFGFRTDAEATRMALAGISRAGDHSYVLLLEGSNAELNRRASEWQMILSSLRAAGVSETSWAGRALRTPTPEELQDAEQFLTRALAETETPGAAVAVIGRDGILFSHGFGVRAQGSNDAVSEHTLFMIGSVTKQFTTLMMARLVDRGTFTWEQPAAEVWPQFVTGNAELTQQITMRHLPCACTGIPQRDLELLFEIDGRNADVAMRELARMQPTTPFGQSFQYSNHMVAAAGFVSAHARYPRLPLDAAWQRTFREEVLGPLGMSESTLLVREALRRNHAMPHAESIPLTGGTRMQAVDVATERFAETIGPAGGLWTNVHDLARYIQMELQNGMLEDHSRYVSETAVAVRRAPMVRTDATSQYALGLFVQTRHGVTTYRHGGGTFGFYSSLEYIPELGIGFVVLRNAASTGSGIFGSLALDKVRELFLAVPFDDNAELARGTTAMHNAEREQMVRVVAIDSQHVAPWIGTFRSEELGTITLRQQGDDFILDVGEWHSRLGALSSSRVLLLDPPVSGLPITLIEEGAALSVEIAQVSLRVPRASTTH